jgi:hypothetical protein
VRALIESAVPGGSPAFAIHHNLDDKPGALYLTTGDAKTLNTQHLFETEVKLFEAQTFPLRPKCCRLQLGPPERGVSRFAVGRRG